MEAVTLLYLETLLFRDAREVGYLIPKDLVLFDAFVIRAFLKPEIYQLFRYKR